MTLFLPLVTTFTDDQTPAANLILHGDVGGRECSFDGGR